MRCPVNSTSCLPGLLQFSVGPPPQTGDEMILPASAVPHITIKEEVGHIRLLVVRAQGLLGTVLVEYRTLPLSAFSPKDYQVWPLLRHVVIS